MTQKELNYIEDIINHERLIITCLENNMIEDEKYAKILDEQIKCHNNMINKFLKLLGGNE